VANDLSSEHRLERVFARYSTPRLTRQYRRRKRLHLHWSNQGRARTSNKRTLLRSHNDTCELRRVGISRRIRERDRESFWCLTLPRWLHFAGRSLWSDNVEHQI
jgi:hypothetical protein